jgi:hypothetical protein
MGGMTGGGMQRPFSGFPAQSGGGMQRPMTGGGMQQPGPPTQRGMMPQPMTGGGMQQSGGMQGNQQVMQALMQMFGGRR